jgi:arginine/lysine/ornithine decarboxylase
MGIDPATVEAALNEHPTAKLVAIVSPSWCGVSSDLRAIADIAHARNVPLYVDQAWGPHFHFHADLPVSAMAAGADAAVTSVHKLLPAISQGSLLMAQGPRINHDRLATAVRMMSTTSPMLPIVASLDAARRQMALEGNVKLGEVINLSRAGRRKIESIGGYSVLSDESLGLPKGRQDVTKLVIDAHQLGISGYDIEHRLNTDHAIAIESADWRGIVANFNLGDTAQSVDRFVEALGAIAMNSSAGRLQADTSRATGVLLASPVQAMSPREAYFSPVRAIKLADSTGEVAAELVTPYPPGIPVLAPGEVITTERIDYLSRIYDRGAIDYGKRNHHGERMISVVDQTRSDR